MTRSPLPNLHDAVLQRVVVDWPPGTAAVECATAADERTVLVIRGLRQVRVDQREPWGASDSINTVYVDEPGGSEVALYIEVQSGDDILIVGEAVEVLAT